MDDTSQAKRLTLRPEWRDNRLSFVASIKPPSPAPNSTPGPTMEDSPLTLQSRPDTFEPKVVGLYRSLFEVRIDSHDDDGLNRQMSKLIPMQEGLGEDDVSEGFWRTLFLLKPDTTALKKMLEETDSHVLLHQEHQSQQLLRQALLHIQAAEAPMDENALDTLTVFFAAILAKRFTNPSSDIIEVLAGLDNVDAVFSDLVATLDDAMTEGRSVEVREKAVSTVIAVVAGGYQTALVSYFIHRDFFPSLMKLANGLDNPMHASKPLLLAGLLANYNKFETHNQYRVRFAELENENTMRTVVQNVAWTTTILREAYIVIQDDTPTGWSVGGTLSYVGLGALTGTKPANPVLTEEQQRVLLAEQPGGQAAVLLTLYDLAVANKTFRQHLVSLPSDINGHVPPFSSFISFASYLFQHAYRTSRASLYAYLTLLIFLALTEDKTTAKSICETAAPVRLCRQRPPQLPLPKRDRPYAASLVDLFIDGINHNLRKKLDHVFYRQIVNTLSRLLAHLTKTRTKLAYHWSELWRSLLAFVRFLTTYAEDLQEQYGISKLAESVIELLAGALTNGEAYLPDATAYDDLIYKLVESGDALVRFRDVYRLGKPTERNAINTLINVSEHYQKLIDTKKSQNTHLSPREVSKIIKQGYETLAIETNNEVEVEERFREADHKVELKKIARVAVADAVKLVS